MSTRPVAGLASESAAADEIQTNVRAFLTSRLKTAVEPDVDLFAAGLVTSLFAMELVVHLEQTFGIAVEGPELRLANFRTVNAMTALVLRLGETTDG